MNLARRSLVLGSLTLVAACGGGRDETPTAPSPGPGSAVTITIGADGVTTPRTVTISPGSRVSFVNNHNRAHDISSDPHPDHTDCPEIDQIGVLQPGQTALTGNLTVTRTCGFHDHNIPTDRNLQGTIRIQ